MFVKTAIQIAQIVMVQMMIIASNAPIHNFQIFKDVRMNAQKDFLEIYKEIFAKNAILVVFSAMEIDKISAYHAMMVFTQTKIVALNVKIRIAKSVLKKDSDGA